MTIHIYSDSFGEEYSGGTWTAELGKLQNQIVVCNGKGGTGPNWSLRKLITHLEDSLPRPPLIHRAHGYFTSLQPQDTIIVLLSDQKRMEFPWLEDDKLSDGIFLLAEDIHEQNTAAGHTLLNYLKGGNPTEKGRGRVQAGNKKRNKRYDKYRYKKHASEIKTVANTLGPMFLYENVKNITFLHLLSKQFRSFKFLVFTCFSLDHHTSKYKNFNIESTKLLHNLDFNYLNTPNFYFVPIPISYMVGSSFSRRRKNHMTKSQNIKFGTMCNDILNNNDPDMSWFVHKPYDDPFAEHQEPEPPPPTFIYE